MNIKQKPEEIVSQFVKDNLSKDINRLKDFCFADLKEPDLKEYRGPGSFDCDNTLLANAIYVLLWGGNGNIFPELTMENVGSGKRFSFRGDTMNSFRTVLKDGNKKYNPTISPDVELWLKQQKAYSKDMEFLPRTISHWSKYGMGEEVKKFYRTYHTIGNFIVLPNRYSPEPKEDTLNMYRGTKWKDFFDRFMIELDKVLSDRKDKDADLSILIDCNRTAFQGKTLPELADALFLCDYMNRENTAPQPLFAPYSMGKFSKKVDDEKYRDFALHYIEKSTEIISRRAEKICSKLSALL